MCPMYDYTCQACDHTDEIVIGVDDAALRECPECGKTEYKRQITGGSGIIFKGSGFPGNDNKGKWHMKDSPKGGRGSRNKVGGHFEHVDGDGTNVGTGIVNGEYKRR